MKIDRVILVSNNNEDYYGFWNPLSKVYKEKFGIEPTLIWVGSDEERNNIGLSDEYGDIITVEPNSDYPLSQCTWASFWATQFYQNDICFICGIDEVPLSGILIKDAIRELSDDDYLMLISDAYLPEHWTNESSTSPSGHHISKGVNFMKIYKFEKNFKDEIEKVFKSGAHESYIKRKPNGYWPVILNQPYWGIDECYYSQILRKNDFDVKIQSLNFFKLMVQRRIDCMRCFEVSFDEEKLKKGWYSQAHLCRPFKNHKNYILNLFEKIPIVK